LVDAVPTPFALVAWVARFRGAFTALVVLLVLFFFEVVSAMFSFVIISIPFAAEAAAR
jgi:hypothetical protein